MSAYLPFLRMVLAQQFGPQTLERRPEPSSITDAASNVVQYDQVMSTKLAIAYATGLDVVHRARAVSGGQAVDLACGPGHYTLALAKYMSYDRVMGIDLSGPMVKVATRSANSQQLANRVQFQVGDITQLDHLETGTFDLGSFTDAAHHLPDLNAVNLVLRQLDRITRADGLVMVMDLARLRTARLTEDYINTFGGDYVARGLPEFLEDFRNSMYAVWTPKEFATVIPTDSARWWCHLVPRGLPTVQIILGLPVGRDRPFLRSPLSARKNPLIDDWYPRWETQVGRQWAKQTLAECGLMRSTLYAGTKRMYPPAAG